MSFPHHDRFWTETAEFLTAKIQPQEKILAPDQFWWLFGQIYRYLNTSLEADCVYEWVVIHKGELHNISRDFLTNLSSQMKPVFANEVFVIWSSNQELVNISSTSEHLHIREQKDPRLLKEVGDLKLTNFHKLNRITIETRYIASLQNLCVS